MSNVTIEQIVEAEKKVIAQQIGSIDDPATVHKIWAIINRYHAQQKKRGSKA